MLRTTAGVWAGSELGSPPARGVSADTTSNLRGCTHTPFDPMSSVLDRASAQGGTRTPSPEGAGLQPAATLHLRRLRRCWPRDAASGGDITSRPLLRGKTSQMVSGEVCHPWSWRESNPRPCHCVRGVLRAQPTLWTSRSCVGALARRCIRLVSRSVGRMPTVTTKPDNDGRHDYSGTRRLPVLTLRGRGCCDWQL